MNICLTIMTKELCRRFFEGFTYDPDMFMDMNRLTTYVYSPEKADAHWQRQLDLERVHLAIMLSDNPIGEIVLKGIDYSSGCCTMGIHMQSDKQKNRGYGTEAEIQALKYAFHKMGLHTVYADAILKNTRSQHVLEKVGFQEMHRDDTFIYYVCEKSSWKRPEGGCKQPLI